MLFYKLPTRLFHRLLAVHQELVEDGVNPTSDEYYQRINAEMRDNFPSAFPSEKKKSNVVASAQRSTAPKKIVLTSTQVAIAKRLNVPLELPKSWINKLFPSFINRACFLDTRFIESYIM
jgi:hypothetical protein